MATSSPSFAEYGCSAVNVANFVSTKLGGSRSKNNYKSWKQQMLCLIESRGLMGYINGKAHPPAPEDDDKDYGAWRRTDWLVKGWILGALSDEALQNVIHLGSARDVWLHLEKNFTMNRQQVFGQLNNPPTPEFNHTPPPPPWPLMPQQPYKYTTMKLPNYYPQTQSAPTYSYPPPPPPPASNPPQQPTGPPAGLAKQQVFGQLNNPPTPGFNHTPPPRPLMNDDPPPPPPSNFPPQQPYKYTSGKLPIYYLQTQSAPTYTYPPTPPASNPPPQLAGLAKQQENRRREYSSLYKAALRSDWDIAEVILVEDPGAIKGRVNFAFETALHVAVGNGASISFVEKLVERSDDSTLSMKDKSGYTPLHTAARMGNFGAAQILVQRHPPLLYIPSLSNKFPVHLAAEAAHRQTLELLISHTKDDLQVNPFAGERGLLLVILLIHAGFLDMALDLVEKYPDLARLNHPITSTALHVISLNYSKLLVEAQLNFRERLIDYFSVSVPALKWIHKKKLVREQALRLLRCICKHMELLEEEEALAIYTGAMQIAARAGSHEVIEVIVATFPSAIRSQEAGTEKGFLHWAILHRCEKVFNLLYQTTNHRYDYTDKIDSSGNSILHLAAFLAPPHKLNLVSGAALQMQRELQWFHEAHKFVGPFIKGRPNNEGKTAEMIFTDEHKNLKEEGERWMKDTANSCTIAAALIVTIVFAAAITVPGGSQSETGYPMMWRESAFTIFAVSDAISLFTSTTSLLMFLSILTSRYAEQDFLYALPKRLGIGLVTLFLSILFMMAAFSSTVYLVFGREKAWVLIPAAALTCLPISSFVLLQFPLLIAVISSTYGNGIFGKQSNRPFP